MESFTTKVKLNVDRVEYSKSGWIHIKVQGITLSLDCAGLDIVSEPTVYVEIPCQASPNTNPPKETSNDAT